MSQDAWAWVKVVCRAFGGGSGFCQMRSFMILNPRVCSAKPRLKMTWWVPVTHKVPSGLRMRRASLSQVRLNSWSLPKP